MGIASSARPSKCLEKRLRTASYFRYVLGFFRVSTCSRYRLTAIRQRAPIVAAGRLARNGSKNPHAVGFESFEKIYPRHTSILNLSPWMDNI